MRKIIFCVLFGLLSKYCLAEAPVDTLYYSSESIEKVFLENNLLLMAEKLNISQADAKILQAKAWPNPTFTLDELQTYISSSTDEIPPVFGKVWRDRNFAMQLEQLIQTAGKRKKNINLEIRNKEMAEIALTDLLQSLKAELRNTVAEIQYLQNVRSSWTIQLQEVIRLVAAQQSQYNSGYISQADLIRLKALEFSLRKELSELASDMNAMQKTLKTLMFVNPQSYIIIRDSLQTTGIAQIKQKTLAQIIDLSGNNARLRISEKQIRISEAQLAIEKAARVPDLTLMSNYDRAGSTMLNFIGLGISMDLPIFNRNKGNIRAAQHEVQKSEILYKNTAAELNNTIVQQWTDLHQAITLYESLESGYVDSLDNMTRAVGRNFSQHNINLLQFLDFYESFRETKEQYYNAIKNILLKKEELNYLLGTEL